MSDHSISRAAHREREHTTADSRAAQHIREQQRELQKFKKLKCKVTATIELKRQMLKKRGAPGEKYIRTGENI